MFDHVRVCILLVFLFQQCQYPNGARLSVRRCKLSEYSCSTGRCLVSRQICDGHPDCPEAEDELECDALDSHDFEMRINQDDVTTDSTFPSEATDFEFYTD